MRREFLRTARVKAPHHVERGEQRVVLLPGSERQSAKDHGRQAPYARIALDDLAKIVGTCLGDGRFGLVNQGFQAFPPERALHGDNLIFAFRFGGEHGLGHAEQSSRRCVERLGAIEHIVFVGAIGAPKDSAEHLVEHGERGVGESGLHLTREYGQRRQTPRRIETRKVLCAHNRAFAGDRRVTGAMNALFAIRSDADLAHGVKPFQDRDEVPLTRRFRPFP